MPVLLASLGKYAQADRSYIFELKPGCTDVLHMTHVWYTEGVTPTFWEMQDIALSSVPNWFFVLNRDGVLVSYDWEQDKGKWPEESALFSGQGITSIILIPLISYGTVMGYMGVDNPERSRVGLSISLLKGIGGHIGGLKENLHMMTKLEESQSSLQNSLKELKKEKLILDALSVDYTSIYYCDLNNDTFIPLKCEDYNNASVAIKEMAEATLNSEIVGAISKIYWLIYRIDLTKGTYEEISARQETHKLTGKKGYIADILQEMYDKIVSDEYRPMMRDFGIYLPCRNG